MKKAIVELESISPYSQSRPHEAPHLEKEGHDDYAKRTWKSFAHADEKGNCFIPPTAFKNCLAEAAKFLSKKIPGQRNATWTKHFDAGVLVVDPCALGVTLEEIQCERLFLNADGVRGSGKRVWKYYPLFQSWKTTCIFHIIDDIITEDVFKEHLTEAGQLIGIGRFRPRNGGFYGRFKVNKVKWENA